MLGPYRQLLAIPGARVFSTAAFVARMPIAMMSLGIVLLVAGRTGKYAVAGTLAATYALVNALSSPMIARLVDRLGQRRVLVPAVAVHAVCLLGFVAMVSAGAPSWTWFLTAAATGASAPPIGSLVRARWGYVVEPGPRLQTAYSLEAVVDEFIFVMGPLLVTLLSTRVDDRAGLLAALGFLVAGSVLFVRHRSSEPPATPRHEPASASVLRVRGMGALVLAMTFIGGVFGGVEISAIAFADEDGRPALAGPFLASYALGSMLAGLRYGALQWRTPLTRRFLVGAAVMTVTVALLPFVHHPAVLAPLLFVAGVGCAPTLIAGLSLVERLVPVARVTEGLTWATTGLIVGLSVASSITGWLVDEVGARLAFTVAGASGAAAVITCAIAYRSLHAAAMAERAATG
jgi:MFS family permease